MKKLLTTIILILPLFCLAQNPYVFTTIKLQGTCGKEDTLFSTHSIKGTSKTFSTKVTQVYSVVNRLALYKPPIVTPPPVNNPPTVNLGIDMEYTLVTGQANQSVTITPVVTDEDLATLKYAWTGGVTTGVFTGFFEVGIHNISLTVTDKNGLTATDALVIKVNAAPIVTPPPAAGERNGIIRYNSFDYTGTFNVKFPLFDTTVQGGKYPALKANIGNAWYFTQNCCPYSINQSQVARSGNGSALYTLKKGDVVSGSIRSELMSIKSDNVAKFERWYGFSINVPQQPDDGLDKSIAQWHQNESSGIPPLAVWLTGSKLQIVQTSTGTINPPGNKYTTVGTLPFGKWVDIVMHVKFSNSSDGLIEFYMDGVLTKTINGPNNYAGSNPGNYFKLGIYKWTWENKPANGDQVQIYYDEFREGNEKSSYKDVAP